MKKENDLKENKRVGIKDNDEYMCRKLIKEMKSKRE